MEEIIFRGLMFKALTKQWNRVVVVAFISFTFAVGHIASMVAIGQSGFDTILQIINALVVGLFYVNYNDDAVKLYIPLLADSGIIARLAPAMPEALVMLVDAEYSGIVINGDNFYYLPLLKVMRKITAAPIGVSVSRYNQEENYTAINSLTDKQGRRVYAHYILGISQTEIARAEGVSVNVVNVAIVAIERGFAAVEHTGLA